MSLWRLTKQTTWGIMFGSLVMPIALALCFSVVCIVVVLSLLVMIFAVVVGVCCVPLVLALPAVFPVWWVVDEVEKKDTVAELAVAAVRQDQT